MTLIMKCSKCGGLVRPKAKKLAVVGGCFAAIAAMGATLATPVGWAAVIPAALTGSAAAQQVLNAKLKAYQASKQAGTYLICHNCGRDVNFGELISGN